MKLWYVVLFVGVVAAVAGSFFFGRTLNSAQEFPAPGSRFTEPPETFAVQFPPPVRYRGWWGQAQRCSGWERPFEDVEFWAVIAENYVSHPSVGEVRFYPNRIYLPINSIFDKGIVMHEMGHILLGEAGHPNPPFGLCFPRYKDGPTSWDPTG